MPLEVIALILYMKALRASPLSLTLPFLGFTPVFLIFTSSVILSEEANVYGYMGIFVIVFGSYLLNISKLKEGFLSPIKSIFSEKGSVYMLIVALIYSLTTCFSKIGIQYSNPLFFANIYILLISINLFFIIPDKSNIFKLFNKEYFIVGLCFGISILFHFLAIDLVIINYMISIKRSSLVIGIILAAIFLNEKKWLEKIIAVLIIFSGIVLITLFG